MFGNFWKIVCIVQLLLVVSMSSSCGEEIGDPIGPQTFGSLSLNGMSPQNLLPQGIELQWTPRGNALNLETIHFTANFETEAFADFLEELPLTCLPNRLSERWGHDALAELLLNFPVQTVEQARLVRSESIASSAPDLEQQWMLGWGASPDVQSHLLEVTQGRLSEQQLAAFNELGWLRFPPETAKADSPAGELIRYLLRVGEEEVLRHLRAEQHSCLEE